MKMLLYDSVLFEGSRYDFGQLFQIMSVLFSKGFFLRTVNIENGDDLSFLSDGYDDL